MKSNVSAYLAQVRDSLERVDLQTVEVIVDLLWDCYRHRRRLAVCGNGGSASTANHIVADLHKNLFVASGEPMWEVQSFCDSVSLITAWSNDTDYANVFAAQTRSWLRPGDLLITISGSGNSANVVNAVRAATEIGATTIAFCGYGGGKLAKLAQVSMTLASTNMQVIEDVHMSVLHGIYLEMLNRVNLTANISLATTEQRKVTSVPLLSEGGVRGGSPSLPVAGAVARNEPG